MSNFVKKYPAISMFVLVMLIGGGMTAPMVAGLIPSDSGAILVAAYSASLAGVILTAIVSGKAGLKKMFCRLLIWRVGVGWWVFSLFAFGLMFLGGTVLAALFSGSALHVNLNRPLYMIVPMIIMQFFFDSGLGEELGWRGFLLPRLQARYNALVSSIIVGVVWGLWHLPLFMLEGMSPTYEFGQTYGVVPSLLGYTVVVVLPYSILFTWLYNNTKGSLLLAFVFHASQAWMHLFMDPDNLIGPFWGFSAIVFVTAIVVVLTSGAKKLSRKHERIMIQDV
jgi:membrane protease YdiL (CAAX protease family)